MTNENSFNADRARKALAHLEKALDLLDASDALAPIGARVDEALNHLRASLADRDFQRFPKVGLNAHES